MSGETEKDESGWTVDTLNYAISRRITDLEKLLDERAQAQDRAVQAALSSAKEAVIKAEAASEKRFESVNEFRKTLSDQAALFLPRTEYDAAHDNLVERVNDLQDRINRSEGKGQGYSVLWGAGIAAFGLLIAIVVAANAVFGK